MCRGFRIKSATFLCTIDFLDVLVCITVLSLQTFNFVRTSFNLGLYLAQTSTHMSAKHLVCGKFWWPAILGKRSAHSSFQKWRLFLQQWWTETGRTETNVNIPAPHQFRPPVFFPPVLGLRVLHQAGPYICCPAGCGLQPHWRRESTVIETESQSSAHVGHVIAFCSWRPAPVRAPLSASPLLLRCRPGRAARRQAALFKLPVTDRHAGALSPP